MATRPIDCQTGPDGLLFDRYDLKYFEAVSSIMTTEMELKDLDFEISGYAMQRFRLKANECTLLDMSNTGTVDGMVKIIIAKVTYPEGKYENMKYINFSYRNKTMPLGKLLLLTGAGGLITDSWNQNENFWDLNSGRTSYQPVYYEEGGIIFCNPHSFDVTLEVLVGA
jgi:hypothetical protein